MRYRWSAVGLDAGAAAGASGTTDGRLPQPGGCPVLRRSDLYGARELYAATEVKDLLLRLAWRGRCGWG